MFRKMSTENISTNPSSGFKVHPMHEADLVRHAVRKIPGAPALVDAWQAQKTGVRQRLPDFRNDANNDLKHHWS